MRQFSPLVAIEAPVAIIVEGSGRSSAYM